jgi:hypothetical protein
MNIQGVQLVLLGFALFMVYVLYLHWKKKELTPLMFMAWLLIWSVFIVLIVFPKILQPYLNSTFNLNVVDLIMVVSFMVLTYVTVENNIKIRTQEEKMEILVRKVAEVKEKKLFK